MRKRSTIRQVEDAVGRETAGKGASFPPLSTGSTLLNLACSGSPMGGFLPGTYSLLVGDSQSGKTFLSMTCFAEAATNHKFKHHRLIYYDVEHGNLIDIPRLFGLEVAKRIEVEYPSTIEEFYYSADDAIKDGRPFVMVLDSMDSLTSDAEVDKFDERKEAHAKGKTTTGSYGDGKAKRNSEGLRKIVSALRKTGSILIIISQTRDNLGFGFEKKTRSGGRALRFYATSEIWSSIKKKINKTVRGKDREIGVKVFLQVKKNRITGKLHEVEMDIYPSYGIDDIGSCVDYLVEEGWWKTKDGKKTIVAADMGLECSRKELIATIEEKGYVNDLRATVGQCWNEIDQACALKRKGRYALGID